jgi:hypothetical protein
MAGKPPGRNPGPKEDPSPDEGALAPELRGRESDAAPDRRTETLGVVELERMVKDDGRALLVFRRTDGR